MLSVVAVAYTGKALHTHSESYYNSLRTTKAATSNGMSDDCPICHYNIIFFSLGTQQSFTFFVLVVTVLFAVATIEYSKSFCRFFSLRAPPAEL